MGCLVMVTMVHKGVGIDRDALVVLMCRQECNLFKVNQGSELG
jgi:hypothetical protein